MTTLFLDLETYSTIPIKQGAHKYAEAAEVLLVALAVDDDPVVVWDTQDMVNWRSSLLAHINAADRVVIHNSAFDRTVLRHNGVHIPVEKVEDTMVTALAHSLPASLGQLCDVLGVPQDKAKDKSGRRFIQLFTKPCPKNWKIRRANRETHPDEWSDFIEYARLDVDAMRNIHGRMPDWNSTRGERHLWQLDQRVNDRGIAVDLDLARAAIGAFQRASRSLAARASNLTDGDVSSTTQRQRFLDYLREVRGFETEDLTKATVETLLKGDLDPHVRELLEIRQQAAATSPAKYNVLLGSTSSDGRLRGTVQFCGAGRTGRDAGRIFQPQNLPRSPDWFDGNVQEATIAAFKHDCEDIIYDNVSERCAFAVRGALVAEPGNKLVIADLSNIEGRVLAWLADEQWKIEAFKLYDRGEGPDLYKVTAGRILGKDPYEVTKGERQTQGKVPELAGGYGGGLGAYRKMGGDVFNAMDDDAIGEIVQAWRKAHPATKRLWYDAEGAVRSAVRNPGESFDVRGLLRVDSAKGPDDVEYVRIRLPSGRYLCYRNMHMDDAGKLLYEGVNQYTRKWELLETYYGKLCIAQGTLVLTDAGWLPIEHVTSLHLLWDGEEWVSNEGLVRKGIKEVICLNGVWMTPDHEVLTTKGWVRASQSEGLERADARIPAGREVPRKRRSQITVVAPLPVREGDTLARYRDNQAAKAGGTSVLRVYAEQDHIGEANNTRHVAPQGVRGVAQHDRQVLATNASGLGALRRAWNNGLRSVAEILHRLLGRYGADLLRGAYVGAPGQFRRVQLAELCMGYTHPTSPQQANQRAYQHAVGSDDSSRSGGPLGVEPDHAVLPSEHRGAGPYAVRGTRHVAEVYDLVNCGPRRRFVVAGENGDTFIVHNCENIVQAVARDVFMTGLRKAEEAGYPVVLRVHDELVCEVPDDPAFTDKTLADMMADNPSWAIGLPLSAAGFEALRYRKE